MVVAVKVALVAAVPLGARLRGLWALHAIGGLKRTWPSDRLSDRLSDKDANVRAWTVQLTLEDGRFPDTRFHDTLAQMARKDPSPVVRLYLASGLQRLDAKDRWIILEGLLTHEEDAKDHNLPLMYWYAAEPLVPADMKRATMLMAQSRIPIVREYITRRMASSPTTKPTTDGK